MFSGKKKQKQKKKEQIQNKNNITLNQLKPYYRL